MLAPLYVCPACAVNPNAHSLKKLYEQENVMYFYTCPAKSELCHDAIGIANHYEGVLREIRQPWIWMFDGEGFGIKHMDIHVGIQLTGILNQYSEFLQKIIVMRPSVYVTTIYSMLYPFLNKKMKTLIHFL